VDPNYLKKHKCFEGLDQKQLIQVSQYYEVECFYPEHILFSEGDEGDQMVLLAEGEAEVLYTIGKEGSTQVDRVSSGEVLGCAALIPPSKHIATTRTLTKVETLVIDAVQLRQLMKNECLIGFAIQQNIIQVLLDRIQDFRLGNMA
jgi:CRP-like cAMP-binding protein